MRSIYFDRFLYSFGTEALFKNRFTMADVLTHFKIQQFLHAISTIKSEEEIVSIKPSVPAIVKLA